MDIRYRCNKPEVKCQSQDIIRRLEKIKLITLVAPRLKSSLQRLYSRHHNLVDRYEISLSHMTNDNGIFTFYVDVFFPLSMPRLLPDLTVYMSNTTGGL